MGFMSPILTPNSGSFAPWRRSVFLVCALPRDFNSAITSSHIMGGLSEEDDPQISQMTQIRNQNTACETKHSSTIHVECNLSFLGFVICVICGSSSSQHTGDRPPLRQHRDRAALAVV